MLLLCPYAYTRMGAASYRPRSPATWASLATSHSVTLSPAANTPRVTPCPKSHSSNPKATVSSCPKSPQYPDIAFPAVQRHFFSCPKSPSTLKVPFPAAQSP
eukprot:1042509-Rhodomonas_salina.1